MSFNRSCSCSGAPPTSRWRFNSITSAERQIMPARAKNASYSELYSEAWKVCVDLWPLWVARFLYLICNYGAFIVCVLFTFWPLVSQVLQNAQGGGHLSSG